MRMSSGPSAWKLKPRSAVSSCGEETPRSKSTPSTFSQPCSFAHVFNSLKFRCCLQNCPGHRASKARAASAAALSRSSPRTCAPASSNARECPPRPKVPSTHRCPRCTCAAASTSRNSTGTCPRFPPPFSSVLTDTCSAHLPAPGRSQRGPLQSHQLKGIAPGQLHDG